MVFIKDVYRSPFFRGSEMDNYYYNTVLRLCNKPTKAEARYIKRELTKGFADCMEKLEHYADLWSYRKEFLESRNEMKEIEIEKKMEKERALDLLNQNFSSDSFDEDAMEIIMQMALTKTYEVYPSERSSVVTYLDNAEHLNTDDWLRERGRII